MAVTKPWVQIQLAVMLRYASHFDAAERFLRSAENSASLLGDEHGANWAAAQRLEVARIRGSGGPIDGAFRLQAQRFQELGDSAGVAWCDNAAAQIMLNSDRPADAALLFTESYGRAMRAADSVEAGWAARGLAEARLKLGELGSATESSKRAEVLFSELGYLNGLAYVNRTWASLKLAVGDARGALQLALTASRGPGLERRTQAYLLRTAALAAETRGDLATSAALLTRADALFVKAGVTPVGPPRM